MAKRGRPPKKSVRRRKNLVIGRGRFKLTTPEIPGYVCRWVNDVGSRIEELTKYNDYDFVLESEINGQVGDPDVSGGNQDLGSRVSRVVGSMDGQPVRAYLLKIRKEFYDEDFAEKQKEIDEVEAQIKRGQFEQPIENKYGKIKISRSS